MAVQRIARVYRHGSLVLDARDDEAEVHRTTGVVVRDERGDVLVDETAVVVITTFRLVLLPVGKAVGWYIPHRLVRRVFHDTSFLQRYYKIMLFASESASAESSARLSFHTKGNAEFYAQLMSTRLMRLWERRRRRRRTRRSCSRSGSGSGSGLSVDGVASPTGDSTAVGARGDASAPDASALPLFSAHNAGIAGLRRRVDESAKESSDTLSAAFADIDALMARTREMVDLAQRLKAQRQRQRKIGVPAEDATGDGVDEDEEDLDDVMVSLGIGGGSTGGNESGAVRMPATARRGADETAFISALAAELAAFVRPVLASERARGSVLLTDVYCLFNRARAADLVSPDDLLAACRACDAQRPSPPFRLVVFASGVMAIQSVDFDEAAVSARVLALADAARGVSPLELAETLGVSLLLARELVARVEASGALCRDESVNGLRFYPNIF